MTEPGQASSCPRCGGVVAGRVDRAYCSNACRQAAYRERRRDERATERLWTGLAAMGEIMRRPFLESRNATAEQSRNGEPMP